MSDDQQDNTEVGSDEEGSRSMSESYPSSYSSSYASSRTGSRMAAPARLTDDGDSESTAGSRPRDPFPVRPRRTLIRTPSVVDWTKSGFARVSTLLKGTGHHSVPDACFDKLVAAHFETISFIEP